MTNPTLDTRVKNLESEFDTMHIRVDVHERALFGGLDPTTGKRHVGVLEQLGDAVTELKNISTAINNVGKLAVAWGGRLMIAGIMGLFAVLWFVVTHLSAFSKAFASASSP